MNARVTSRDVKVGDLTFRLHEAGTPADEAILFLHGSGPGATGLSNWERIIADLASSFYCIAPDMIGFGDSSHPDPAPQGMAAFNEVRTAALFGLLDALGLTKVHLVGNSMGGSIALLMVLQAPEKVGKVVLMGSGGAPDLPASPGLRHLREFYADPAPESLRELLRQFVYDLEPLSDRIDQVVAERMSYVVRDDVRRSHAGSFNMAPARRFFHPDELATIEHDVLVVHGRDDRIIPLAASTYFATHIPSADLYVLGQCGHWTQIEHPEKFEYLVTGFIAGEL
ncbi:alpha/beta fold hydrolase [Actinoallomurus iriomotensis]|uniref:2,6-dioxo-6-phenylhexa-3-enoate hydrolase n=1 Tax=Actinoallomurus iriomotensis TaxID=478107 RepID=A0A9W6SFD8_9ACTN|nr:alpha/beta hydrolase [Actinoallomurus iriomotensis]GLY91825.1 2,6-dioxo-6-phenylhexa-3-enoate hydrolase [Actinoallomurus iriomotensis]